MTATKSASAQFIEQIAQAKLAAIGGVLAPDCRDGLIRRGATYGMTDKAARQAIAKTKPARRAPRIMDQWK